MINSVIFEGVLVREPEEKAFPNGGKYAIMVLGNSKKFTKQDGTIAENKCYIEVQVFGKQSEVVMKHLSKGCRVTTQGEINLLSWQDQSGAKKSKHILVARELSIFTFKKTEGQPSHTQEQSKEEKLRNARVENVSLSHLSEIQIQENEIPQDLLSLAEQQTQQGGENV